MASTWIGSNCPFGVSLGSPPHYSQWIHSNGLPYNSLAKAPSPLKFTLTNFLHGALCFGNQQLSRSLWNLQSTVLSLQQCSLSLSPHALVLIDCCAVICRWITAADQHHSLWWGQQIEVCTITGWGGCVLLLSLQWKSSFICFKKRKEKCVQSVCPSGACNKNLL
jgi:hypothetical protein